jgi:hypothetical protein
MAAALSGVLAVRGQSQQYTGAPVPTYGGWTEANPLPNLPRPPDQPASLLQPAPTAPVYGCAEFESPYFQKDPRLDLPGSAQPGWLVDVEFGIIGSSVVQRLGQTDPAGQITVAVPGTSHTADVAAVPMARLDWTVSPRFEFGYRLPAGFGEVDVAYRFLQADGSGSTPAGSIASPDAAAVLSSHLNMNLGDLDYASHETSLGPWCDMKWRIGLRYADVFFDSRADEPVTAAAAGSGVYERAISDNFWGIGPHVGVELSTQRNTGGFRWVGRLDVALLFGEVEQRFSETSTTPGASAYLGGETHFVNDQQVPTLGGFLGLEWRPPQLPSLDLLLGCSAEYWWNVGRLSDPDFYSGQSAGEVGLQGAVLRLEYNY